MTTLKDTLKFGLRDAVPDEAAAAWGARLIYPDNVVPDRVNCVGAHSARAALLAHLRDAAGNKPWQRARELHACGALRPSSTSNVTLFEDDHCLVVGNPRGGSGYLYVAAWLKPTAANEDQPRATFQSELDALQSACEYSSEPTDEGEHPVTGAPVNDSVNALIDYKDALEDRLGEQWNQAQAWQRLAPDLDAHAAGLISAPELCTRALQLRNDLRADTKPAGR